MDRNVSYQQKLETNWLIYQGNFPKDVIIEILKSRKPFKSEEFPCHKKNPDQNQS